MVNVLWLIFAVMLGAGRSVFSKRMKSDTQKSFYFNQFFLFLSGTIGIFLCNVKISLCIQNAQNQKKDAISSHIIQNIVPDPT
jgi:hypothetical protein